HEKVEQRSLQPRGPPARRLAHPRSPSYPESAREDPVVFACRMVAAHGGLGVGAAAGLQRGVIMVGLVVAAHGRLAAELVATAEQIMGAMPEVATVSIAPG